MKLEDLNSKQQEVIGKSLTNVILTLKLTNAEKGQVEQKEMMHLLFFSFNNNANGYLSITERLECLPILIDIFAENGNKIYNPKKHIK